MPYDPGPQRKAKAAAMVNALDVARRASPDGNPSAEPLPWTTVEAALANYGPASWKDLSVAAGRPNRLPSVDTRQEVTNMVAAAAEAERQVASMTADEKRALFERLG